MSLTIKKKSNFKPKAAPRRPGGASTQTSTRPSVERQSQTPNPSIPSETLSISGGNQDNEARREISIAEYTPQPTSSEITPQLNHQTTYPIEKDVSAQSPTHSGQHRPPGDPSSEVDVAFQRKTLPSELPTQAPPALVRDDNLGAYVQQIDSVRRNDAPTFNSGQQRTRTVDPEPIVEAALSKRTVAPERGLMGTARKRTRIELQHTSTEANIPEISTSSKFVGHTSIAQPGGLESPNRASRNEPLPKSNNTSAETDNAMVTIQGTKTANLVQPSNVRQDNPSSIYPDPELSRTSGGTLSQLPRGADFPTDQPLQTIGTAAINPDGSASLVGQLVHTAGMNPDGTAGQAASNAAPPLKKKRASKKSKKSTTVVGDNDGPPSTRAGIEMTLNKTRRVPGEKRGRQKRALSKGTKKRGETPEGAEDEEVDPAVMTLQEICKDPKIGKKFSRAEQIRKQMLEREKEKKRQKVENDMLWSTTLTDDEGEGEGEGVAEVEGDIEVEATEGDNQEKVSAVEKPQEPAPVISGPQMVVGPDGRITIVQSSLQFNRNAAAEVARGGEQEQQVDDFSRLVNGGSHVRRTAKREWTVTDEEKFWEILREYGTDFEMMAATLGRGRTARQCKLKFRKEEKLNPARIDRAFRGIPEPIEDDDMPGVNTSPTATPEEAPEPGDLVKKYRREIEASLGERLEDPAAIMESLEAARKAQELGELEAEKEIEAENARKERDIISGQDRRNRIANGLPVDEEGGDQENAGPFNGREASAAPKTKQKANKRRGKKNPHSSGAYGGGTEFIIESTEA